MKVEYERRRHVQRASRWADSARFVFSAVALWALCATGIYLIGPDESALVSDAAPAQRALASDRAAVTTVAYHP